MDQFFVPWACFLLILVRITGFFVQGAIWGNRVIPHQVLVGCALGFSVVMFPSVKAPALFEHFKTPQGSQMDLFYFGVLIFQQFGVGLVLGFISYICFAIVQFAGQLFDIQMGLSSAASADPASHGTLTMLNRMTFYLAMNLYLLTDGHIRTLMAMKRSFEVIPLDCFNFNKPLMDILWMRTEEMFTVGLELAAPVVAALFIVQVSLGMVARVAPQMNVFMLSFPMNIGIGLTILTSSWDKIERRFADLFDRDFYSMLKAALLMGPHHLPGVGGR